MTISKDLLLAILSLDSYNRGYHSGVDGLSDELNTQVGNVKVTKRLKDVSQTFQNDAKAAGFYAISYKIDAGSKIDGLNTNDTIIAYRGTDEAFGSETTGSDLWRGWAIATGAADPDGAGSQAGLALQFYQSVTGNSILDGRQDDVVLTGHSLGGGLAGLVGSLTGTDATLFDHMPFTIAAGLMYLNQNPAIPLPTYSHLDAQHVTGEVLALGRAIGPAAELALATAYFPWLGVPLTAYVAGAELSFANQAIDSNGGIRSVVSLHSQALLVTLKYAEDNNIVSWHSVGAELWDAAFSDDVGEAAGFPKSNPLTSHYSESAKMLAAIAYSALEDGTLIFGNTGIRALYDDAGELGALKERDGLSVNIENALPGLSETIMQFAGQMALQKVDYTNHLGNDPREGIIYFSNDGEKIEPSVDANGDAIDETVDADILTIDLSKALWNMADGDVEIDPDRDVNVLGLSTILDDFFDHDEFANDKQSELFAALELLLGEGSGDPDDPKNITSYIGRINFALENNLTESRLADRSENGGVGELGDQTEVYISGDGEQKIYGNRDNNLIVGSTENDWLTGGFGKDILLGRKGNDVFVDAIAQDFGDVIIPSDDLNNDIYIGGMEHVKTVV